MTRTPDDNKKGGGVPSPQRDDSNKHLNEERFRESNRPWNVEPIKQTTEPPPRPKR